MADEKVNLKPVVTDNKIQQDEMAFLELVEEQLMSLARAHPKMDPMYPNGIPYGVANSPTFDLVMECRKIARIAWAFQRFPILDVKILSRLRRQTFQIDGRDGTKRQTEFYVPELFWCSNYQVGHALSWHVGCYAKYGGSGEHCAHLGCDIQVKYDESAIEHNRQASDGRDWLAINTSTPPVPIDVERRISKLGQNFDEVKIIFEAAWEPIIKPDPLVVGIIGKHCFIIDHFDVSKLERYVLAEFVTKPT
jgi:hypothetical protein